MNGNIKHEWGQLAFHNIFTQNFRIKANTVQFVNARIQGTFANQMTNPYAQWNIHTFHALFVASWIYHPTEKGTYFISCPNNKQAVANACEAHLKKRISSHLSGKAYSAAQGWGFLNGYNELLVQVEGNIGNPTLMLKAEGHTMGLAHLKSQLVKSKTGAGLTVSEKFHAVAQASQNMESRAAENFDKEFNNLLKILYPRRLGYTRRNLKTVDIVRELFQQTGHFAQIPPNPTNQQLADAIDVFRMSGRLLKGKNFSQGLLNELYSLSASLKAPIRRNEAASANVFKEVHINSAQLANSFQNFSN